MLTKTRSFAEKFGLFKVAATSAPDKTYKNPNGSGSTSTSSDGSSSSSSSSSSSGAPSTGIYKCKIPGCEKDYAFLRDLRSHMRNDHSNESGDGLYKNAVTRTNITAPSADAASAESTAASPRASIVSNGSTVETDSISSTQEASSSSSSSSSSPSSSSSSSPSSMAQALASMAAHKTDSPLDTSKYPNNYNHSNNNNNNNNENGGSGSSNAPDPNSGYPSGSYLSFPQYAAARDSLYEDDDFIRAANHKFSLVYGDVILTESPYGYDDFKKLLTHHAVEPHAHGSLPPRKGVLRKEGSTGKYKNNNNSSSSSNSLLNNDKSKTISRSSSTDLNNDNDNNDNSNNNNNRSNGKGKLNRNEYDDDNDDGNENDDDDDVDDNDNNDDDNDDEEVVRYTFSLGGATLSSSNLTETSESIAFRRSSSSDPAFKPVSSGETTIVTAVLSSSPGGDAGGSLLATVMGAEEFEKEEILREHLEMEAKRAVEIDMNENLNNSSSNNNSNNNNNNNNNNNQNNKKKNNFDSDTDTDNDCDNELASKKTPPKPRKITVQFDTKIRVGDTYLKSKYKRSYSSKEPTAKDLEKMEDEVRKLNLELGLTPKPSYYSH